MWEEEIRKSGKGGKKRKRKNPVKQERNNVTDKIKDTLDQLATMQLNGPKKYSKASLRTFEGSAVTNISDDFDDDSEEESRVILNPKKSELKIDNDDPSESYLTKIPIELLFEISTYLTPMDIRSFALTCKRTNAVVNSASFWIHLYKKYCLLKKVLPNELGSSILKNRKGLKTKVVLSLCHTYQPLMKSEKDDYTKLVGLKCISGYGKLLKKDRNEDNRYIYRFKFSPIDLDRKFRIAAQPSSPIHMNPDEGNIILEVVLDRYNIIKMEILQRKLRSIRFSPLTSSISMEFGPIHLPISSKVESTILYLSKTIGKPLLYNWWHKSFYSP